MEFDYKKLNSRISEVFGTQDNYAKKAEMSRTTLNKKLNNVTKFNVDDMKRASELLEFENGVEDIPSYFFKEKV